MKPSSTDDLDSGITGLQSVTRVRLTMQFPPISPWFPYVLYPYIQAAIAFGFGLLCLFYVLLPFLIYQRCGAILRRLEQIERTTVRSNMTLEDRLERRISPTN